MPQTGQAGGSPLMGFLPLLLIFFIFYFLLILPQQKKERQRREMIDNLKRGNKVITIGGMIGEIEEIKGKIVSLKISENVKVEVVKTAITQIFSPE